MTNDSNQCDQIIARLFTLKSNDSMTNDMKKHLEQCVACSAVYQDILAINQGVQSLPEHDVSDAVFNQTLKAIQTEQSDVKTKPKGINPQWATGMAASFVLVAVAGLIYNGSISEFQVDFNQAPFAAESDAQVDKRDNRQKPADGNATINDDEPSTAVDVVYLEDLDLGAEASTIAMRAPAKPAPAMKNTMDEIRAKQPATMNAPELEDNSLGNADFDEAKVVADQLLTDDKMDMDGLAQNNKQTGSITVTGSRIKRSESNASEPNQLNQLLNAVSKKATQGSKENTRREAEFNQQEKDNSPVALDELLSSVQKSATLNPEETQRYIEQLKQQATMSKNNVKRKRFALDETSESIITEAKEEGSTLLRNDQFRATSKGETLQRQVKEEEVVEEGEAEVLGESARGAVRHQYSNTEPSIEVTSDLAQQYLSELSRTDNLKFKAATGYWANTYVPGDPDMRWIQAQLQKDSILNLPVASQNRQPFDYPTNAALGLFLNSDRKTLNESGPTRMRLQVGIQAGQQKGGHRSALNLAVVLDLGQHQRDASLKAESKALLSALLKAKQPADQISVYIADRGLIIAAADFKHGPIQVALEQVFSSEIEPQSVNNILHQTLSAANSWLKTQDDPSAVLGSSAVLLVSGNAELTELSSIEGLVQKNAIDGITLSTVSLIGIDHKNQLERLALLGQGHSRVLAGVQGAQRLINEELLVSSRAVARALRLQIKLAEGVQLIDVLDSYSLDEAQAQKVREAEQSLDQRMSKNLGIKADRGQDDDGIQIVIPSYFAGDTHVILIDVLVQNPGPVAEVTAKYKDLIYLKNATSQMNLHMRQGNNELGPLELNVMKNVLAQRLSQTIKQASQALYAGDVDTAVTKLNYILKLYQAMRQHMPVWKNDAEMIQDETIIKQYLHLLNTQSSLDPKQHQLIADAMNFMSWRKLISHSP